MNNKKQAIIRLTYESLLQELKLQNVYIIDILSEDFDRRTNCIRLKIIGEDLPDVREGDELMWIDINRCKTSAEEPESIYKLLL